MHRLASVLCLVILFFSSAASASNKLVFSGMDAAVVNSSAQVLKYAYSQMGIEIATRYYPIERALHSANAGLVDGEIVKIGGLEKQFPNLIQIPVPIFHTELVAISKNPDIKISGWESLAPYRLGLVRGVRIIQKGLKKGGCKNFVTSIDPDHIVKMLEADRIDIGIISRLGAMKALKHSQSNTIKILEPTIEVTPMYHYLNKEHADIVPKLISTLSQMNKSGQIAKINQHFIKHLLKQ
ncbi:substrate-binding periplasmic protein [Maridesulfovibrio sp.]|uniref:substrate-binding periplasmic protein n=1 Tax=Maridesulfovibrio sp. TaxID=2795000 RepID=UPI003B0029BA